MVDTACMDKNVLHWCSLGGKIVKKFSYVLVHDIVAKFSKYYIILPPPPPTQGLTISMLALPFELQSSLEYNPDIRSGLGWVLGLV